MNEKNIFELALDKAAQMPITFDQELAQISMPAVLILNGLERFEIVDHRWRNISFDGIVTVNPEENAVCITSPNPKMIREGMIVKS